MEALGKIHAEIAKLNTNHDWVKEEIQEIKAWIKNRDTESNHKYAAKWVEWLAKGAVGTILITLLAAGLSLLLVKPAQSAITYLINLI
jgi:hypothetical protein